MTLAEETAARTGVADYFAVLGVGDRLTWKHQQKQQEEGTALEEEEEDHQQRFEREIVDVNIVVTDESFLTATPSQDPSVDDSSSRAQRSIFNANIPPSPSHSEATTSFTTSSNAPIVLSSSHRTDDGWVVLEKTLASATPVQAASGTRIPGSPSKGPMVWKKGTVWDANLDFVSGLSSHVSERLMGSPTQPKPNKPLTGLRRKVESTCLSPKAAVDFQS